jgi:Na+/H+-translocating membrane pyrophosphatase
MVFTAFIVLTFYGLGAGYLESFVNYPLWRIIGETDRWVEYHQALGPRILIVLVIPALVLLVITNVLLFFFRPDAVPRWTVAMALGLLLTATISTAVVQIPIQIQLDVAYERVALDRLITSSLWLRDVVGGVRAVLVAYMLHRVVSTSTRPSAAAVAAA